MIGLLTVVAAGLAVSSTLLVVVLVARRVTVAGAQRRERELAERLRPLALDVVDGDGEAPDVDLGEAEARILASLLTRYAREVRGAARARITTFFEEQGAVAEQRRRLGSRRSWRRATAAAALGDMGSADAVRPLLSALDDRDAEVRAAAATALGRLGAAEAATPLAVALTDGAVPRSVGGHALLLLEGAGIPSLLELSHADDPALRSTAVEALGWIGGAAEGEQLSARLRDPSAEVRAKACAALGRLGAEDEASALRAALDDRIPAVRAAAATALGRLDDEDAVLALARQAHLDEHVPAAAAASALARIAPAAVGTAASAPGAGLHLHEAADLLEVARA